MSQFVHLHVHTQYSVLDGMANISGLFQKAKNDGQKALAITDHGNMFGVKEFLRTAEKTPEVKAIVGCEVYVSPEGRHLRRGKEDQSSNHLILLAKNITGYHNLVKLVSYAYTEGFYYKPRIDHELLEKYKEGLIACSACLAGEVPRAIAQNDMAKAEEIILWYKKLFGDDYYLELQRHKTDDPFADQEVYPLQMKVGEMLVQLAQKHNVKLIATNDVHFINADDAEAHDRLICLNTGADLDDMNRMRYTKQEWLKTQDEMSNLFADIPEAIANTLEIAEKIETYSIDSAPIMPNFPLPEGFSCPNEYLHYLTYKGSEKRYGEVNEETKKRIDFELETIKTMGFPDYFLIVQDFIREAREMGVIVGPGRGSAAGSVVAYCLEITDIDPLKYNLLFERFLNPDRISMPDIDIDFDDDGRAKVLKYVEDKYGKEQVSHVITFGTMATKSAIRDVARVQKLSLSESDRLAKAVPMRWDKQTVNEKGKVTKDSKTLPITLENCIQHIPELQQAAKSDDPLMSDTIKYALQLEGSIRSTGVHACAVIIGRNNLMEHIPISTAKDKDTGEDIWVSQYEGACIEDVGMLKMDFLGLKTLSILRDAVENVKITRDIDVDINIARFPLNDTKTFELFSRAETVGTFQFESDGMRKWLRELKPTRFEDLIAMNALYRPGPMDYIPEFIERKHDSKKIVYDLPEMEEFLSETYGITVYQEQVMLLSQKIAGFTKGQADTLRKAMGKKQRETLNKMKKTFLQGAADNGHGEEICAKIWGDWEKFAEYAFNKSHSTCYAMLGYQTAYLKAHYPAEYMAAVLSRNLDNIDEISKFMDECRAMGIQVLEPAVNESHQKFTVNSKGNIRFGMAAIKGVGAAAVDTIVEERRNNGAFKDIFDFVERIPLTTINRKTMEALALAGAFDEFAAIKRYQFFGKNTKDEAFLDSLLRYGNKIQADKAQSTNSLFGGQHAVAVTKPEIPTDVEEWTVLETLKKEKELIGMYISAHPLDIHKFEITHFASHKLSEIDEMLAVAKDNPEIQKKKISLVGIITNVRMGVSKKNGRPYLNFTLEDYSGTYQFGLFGKDYENFSKYIQINHTLLIRGGFQTRFKPQGDDRPAEWIFSITAMYYLAHVCDELVKNIQIVLPVKSLTPSFNERLAKCITDNKGKIEFRIKLVDEEHALSVTTFSRPFPVAITPELLSFFELENLNIRVNA